MGCIRNLGHFGMILVNIDHFGATVQKGYMRPFKPPLRSNVFLISLCPFSSFCYTLPTFCFPISAWTMGWLVCKTIPYLQGVSVNASINTLVAISVERCLAICYPLRWQMTSKACKLAVLVIWFFSLTITLPWALFFKLQPLEEGSDFQVRI